MGIYIYIFIYIYTLHANVWVCNIYVHILFPLQNTYTHTHTHTHACTHTHTHTHTLANTYIHRLYSKLTLEVMLSIAFGIALDIQNGKGGEIYQAVSDMFNLREDLDLMWVLFITGENSTFLTKVTNCTRLTYTHTQCTHTRA